MAVQDPAGIRGEAALRIEPDDTPQEDHGRIHVPLLLDEEMGGAFAKRPAQIPLLVWWQSAIWPRDPDAFWAALIAGKPAERVDRLTKLPARGPNPHDAIVPLAFDNMLRELLPNEPAGRDEDVTPPT